ncbi:unnamed protein product, partial [Durusdinium trenchii]
CHYLFLELYSFGLGTWLAWFGPAIIRLYEEKNGIQQHDLDFDFPPDDEEWEQEEPWTSWGYEDEETQTSPVGSTHAAAADSGSPHGNYARATTSSSPSRHSAGVQWDLPGVTELSLADSFVLGVLRGFRLLQASGLSPDDMRDIISATKGSLEFEVVTKALQTLWDDQLVGRRHAGGWSPSKTHEAMFEEATSPSDDWWDDANVAQYDDNYDDWWQDDEEWGYAIEEHEGTKASEEDDDAIKEAQKAEQIAEGLAMEAQRSWAEAQRATQALRKDRGFGHLIGGGKGSSPARCWTCGGPHFSRDCPDRRHPSVGKGKGWKGHYMTDELYYMKGKGKKGKTASWMELQAFQKGKSSKSGKGKKGTMSRPSVNAYTNELFGLEFSGALDVHSATSPVATMALVSSILTKDSQASVDPYKNARPFFRFGNGGWGRALYQVVLTSTVMGGRTPTATICLLMQKKIDADEALQGMVEPVFQRVPQLSEKPPFYDKEMIKVKKGNKKSSRDTSPAPSWDKDYMDPSEMEHLMKMLQERKAAAKQAVDMETGSGSLASAYEPFEELYDEQPSHFIPEENDTGFSEHYTIFQECYYQFIQSFYQDAYASALEDRR